ncbi:uncharacterized protein LOC116144763 [Pistacia vera]|uniref:uncharacterized protein LOC116144763 n=1 Tax=Pistacia vera TaxID=55513 RepID=UPI0012633258|nr:uncharacterized protein LOC116144763 [Pistacia vera]
MDNEWLNSYEFSRMLEFKYDSTISLEELQIFKNVELLRLAEFSDDDNNLTPLFNEKVIFSNLVALKLEVTSSRKIWDSQCPTFMSSLTSLTLTRCRKIKYAFSFCIAKSLKTLQHLEISHCEVLDEIVAEEEAAKEVVNFAFPRITFLMLEDLPKLATFCHGIDTWELPMLKRLKVTECEKFTSKYLTFHESSFHKPLCLDNKINSNLEDLYLKSKFRRISWQSRFKTLKIIFDRLANIPLGLLHRFENLEKLQLYYCGYKEMFLCGKDEKHMQITLGPSLAFFQNLQVLNVRQCKKLMKLMTPAMPRSLVQLRELSVKGCEMVIEIVENEGDATRSTEIVFDNLKKLSLEYLKSLICFCSGNYSFNFPSLEKLIIRECPNVLCFCFGNHYFNFPSLEKLIIRECLNMKTFSRGILSTPKLHKVSYESFNETNRKWEKIKEVENERNDLNKTIHGAYKEHLQNLPELATFYLGIHTSKWPMLKELVVRDCEKFTSKHMSFQEDGKEGELHISEPKSLFLDDKINQDLEVFELRNGGKGIRWWSQSKALHISYDNSTNIPLGVLQRFEKLKELKLFCCDQYKELFFPSLPNLEVLDLQSCSKYMSLVPSSASFQNLEVIRVDYCNGFMKLITPSTARNLVQLREMSIKDCGLLIEIVENEGEGDTTISTEIVFDNLKKLSLSWLESLTCFCSGNYSINFPSLEELIIKFYPNMKTFSQGISSTPKLHKVNYVSSSTKMMKKAEVENRGNDLNTTIQHAHKKEVDSNSEELTLSGRDIMSIWEGEFQESFGKVKTRQLINDVYTNIPIPILHKFISLEKLILKVSSYEEVFSFEEDKEHVGALTKLKDLKLQGLFNLKCIWKQDSRLNLILQNLDSLKVKYCHYLTTLLPSLASFENLRILKVSYCNEMQNLMSSSTAKSLLLLERLIIDDCEMIMEVVANEGDIEKDEIVFEKLEELIFYNLKSLTCFCFGNYTLKFPNLESLYVSECSKMKTFSGGGLNMPRLFRFL